MKKRKYAIYAEPPQPEPAEPTRDKIKPLSRPPKKYFYSEPPQIDTTAKRPTQLTVRAVKNAPTRQRVWIEQPTATPGLQSKGRRAKRGRLAGFMELPTDVLIEIWQYVLPYDILIFSRLCKHFRAILMSSSSRFIWRRCALNYRGFPECPEGWIEPRWFDLCLVPYCNFCFKAYVKKAKWRLRMRICNRCSRFRILERRKQNTTALNPWDPNYPIHYLIPSEPGRRDILREFYVPDYERSKRKYDSLQKKDRPTYVMERRSVLLTLERHAVMCAQWEKNRKNFHDDRLKEMKRRRLKRITDKLVDLGYANEIRQIMPPDSLAKHPVVNRPQVLTPRIWGQIKPDMIKFMHLMKERRLQREHSRLILDRKVFAAGILRKWKKTRSPEKEVLPNVLDFCEFLPVKEILAQPLEATIDESCFTDTVMQQINYCLLKWQERLPFTLGERVRSLEEDARASAKTNNYTNDQFKYRGGDFPLAMDKIINKLPLATSAFICHRCATGQDEPGTIPFNPAQKRYRPLHFPEMLDHKCFTRWICPYGACPGGCINRVEPAAQIEGYHGWRVKWGVTGTVKIEYDWRLSRSIRKLVTMTGLNYRHATVQKMCERDDWFACQACATEVEDNVVKTVAFKWREAAQHWRENHAYEVDLEWVHMDHQTIVEGNEAYVALGLEPTTATKKFPEARYACVHCKDLRTEVQPAPMLHILAHLNTEHMQGNPVENKDYYRLLEDCYTEIGACDIACLDEVEAVPDTRRRRRR